MNILVFFLPCLLNVTVYKALHHYFEFIADGEFKID